MYTLTMLIALLAVITAVNPPTMHVISQSVEYILGKGRHPRHAGTHTIAFALGVAVASLLITSVWWAILTLLPFGVVGYILVVLAVCAVLCGLLEVKDYYWFGRGLSFTFSEKIGSKLKVWARHHHARHRGFLLGLYVSLKLLHYTNVLAIAVTTLGFVLRRHDWTTPLQWSLWYAAPLLVIGLLVASGVNASALSTWKEQSKHHMRLSVGLAYILFGLVALTVVAGGIKLV